MLERVLFICPEFHNYENEIVKELKTKFNHVDTITYDELQYIKINKLQSKWIKLKRLFTGVESKVLKGKYLYKNNFSSLNKDIGKYDFEYDRLLVIKGYGIYPETIRNIKAKVKTIYQWDTISRYPLVKDIYHCFDYVFTFDREDSKSGYGCYLPNFLCKTNVVSDVHHDVFYVGSLNKERYEYFSWLTEKLRLQGFNYFIKLIGDTRKYKDVDFIQSYEIDKDEYNQLLAASKGVIEFGREGQYGFTQRYYEGMLNKKVVLTVGKYNVNDDEAPYIMAIGDEGFIDRTLLNQKYNALTKLPLPAIVDDIELGNWLDKVLCLR